MEDGLKKLRNKPIFFKIGVNGKIEPTFKCINCGKMRYSECRCIKKIKKEGE